MNFSDLERDAYMRVLASLALNGPARVAIPHADEVCVTYKMSPGQTYLFAILEKRSGGDHQSRVRRSVAISVNPEDQCWHLEDNKVWKAPAQPYHSRTGGASASLDLNKKPVGAPPMWCKEDPS